MKKGMLFVLLGIFFLPEVTFALFDPTGPMQLAYLAKILEENVRHYYQLKTMIDTAHSTEDYLRTLNAGIDNSVGLLQALPVHDEKILAELKDFQSASGKVSDLYGSVPTSDAAVMQTLHDDTIAESLRMVTSFKDYSKTAEENSVKIVMESREASPKGVARMQAETSAEILQSMAELIRLNSQMLKLQSEQFGMENKSGKDGVRNFERVNDDFGKGFGTLNSKMELIRF